MSSFSNIVVRSTTAAMMVTSIMCANAGIDLTPAVSEYTAEGITFRQLNFKDGKQKIEYELPRGWTYEGNSSELKLRPPNSMFAEAVITAVPSAAKLPQINAEIAKPIEQQAMQTLPVGSQFAKIERELENPLLLNGNSTFEITVSYQLAGEKFSRSVLLANIADTQLTFRLTAKAADFPTLQRDFRSSILSWHRIEEPDSAQQSSASVSTAR